MDKSDLAALWGRNSSDLTVQTLCQLGFRPRHSHPTIRFQIGTISLIRSIAQSLCSSFVVGRESFWVRVMPYPVRSVASVAILSRTINHTVL